MQSLKDYFAIDGWRKDWEETKELYEEGLGSRIKDALLIYDREMCRGNPDYKVPTTLLACTLLSLGILDPNAYRGALDVNLQPHGFIAGISTILYMTTNVLRNPDRFNLH